MAKWCATGCQNRVSSRVARQVCSGRKSTAVIEQAGRQHPCAHHSRPSPGPRRGFPLTAEIAVGRV